MCEQSKAHLHRGRTTASHVVVPLAQRKRAVTPVMCPTHPKEEAKLWDTACESLLCVLCLGLSHRGHACQTLEEAAIAGKSELAESAKDAQAKLHTLDQAQAEVEARKQLVQAQSIVLEQDIQECFQRVLPKLWVVVYNAADAGTSRATTAGTPLDAG